MIEAILGSIASGGLTGLLGAGLQRYFDYKHAKLQLDRDRAKYAHELVMRDKDRELMKEEWAGRFKVAEVEGATARDVAESSAFSASMFREPERYAGGDRPKGWLGDFGWFLLACTDVLRGIVRPGLTLYLCILVTYIWYLVRQLIANEPLDPLQVMDIWKLVVQTILYVWTTCTLWWFGTRNKAPQPRM